MTVDPAHAAGSYEYGGTKWYFCNLHCLEKFRAEPEKYTGAKPETAPHEPPAAVTPGATYTCPMHPEILRNGPGSCPICGMALEPRVVTLDEEENPERTDMRRRFRASVILTAPLVLMSMAAMMVGAPAAHYFAGPAAVWIEFLLATPVVLWGGWPFFERAWASIVHRSPNMFTLIGMGTGTAYVYSVAATLVPSVFPDSFRGHGGEVARVLRASSGDHNASAAGAGAGAARPQPDVQRDPSRCSGWRRKRRASCGPAAPRRI